VQPFATKKVQSLLKYRPNKTFACGAINQRVPPLGILSIRSVQN